jgi:hypothetical protein
MPSYAIFAPLRPRAVDLGAGCLACGVRLKDCAVTITTSLDMIAATTASCRADTMLQQPLGTWAMGHLRTAC